MDSSIKSAEAIMQKQPDIQNDLFMQLMRYNFVRRYDSFWAVHMSLNISSNDILYSLPILKRVTIVMFFPASIFWRCRQETNPCSSACSRVQPFCCLIFRSLRPRRFRKTLSGVLEVIDFKIKISLPISSTSDNTYFRAI